MHRRHSISSCPHDFGQVDTRLKRNYEIFFAELSHNAGLMFQFSMEMHRLSNLIFQQFADVISHNAL